MEKKPSLEMPSDSDLEHLRLLSIFHYVLAAIMALVSLIPIIHLCVGILLVSGAIEPHDQEGVYVLELVGVMFTIIPAIMILLGLTISVLVAIAGRRLARHTHYTFCLVVAAVTCTFFPFGTVLGVFTILVLTRPGMRTWFEA